MFFLGCSDDPQPLPTPLEGGVLVVNEGQFLAENADLTVFFPSTGEVTNGVFAQVNGRPLGDVLQSVARANGSLFLVVNNSNKVEVIDALTGVNTSTLEGLSLPRYFLQVSPTKAYITEWVGFGISGRISVVDLTTLTVTGTIDLNYVQPETLTLAGGVVAVASNSFSGEDGIFLLDATTDEILGELPLEGTPNGVVTTADGQIWVLTADYYDPTTFLPTGSGKATLTRIDPATQTVAETVELPQADAATEDLVLQANQADLAFRYGATISRYSVATGDLSTWVEETYYGIGVDGEGNLYTADAGNFVAAGTVRVYDPQGNLIQSFTPGIAPNGFVFPE